jgi:hypothetical protein
VVEGIEFRYARPGVGGVIQLFGVTSELRMAHCRVVAQGETTGIWLGRGLVQLDHCAILGSNWSILRWNFDGAARLTVTDSILAAPQAILTLHSGLKRDETPDFVVELKRSTAVSGDQELLWLVDVAQPGLKEGHKPISLQGTECVFSSSGPQPRVLGVVCKADEYLDAAAATALLRRTVAWGEERNLYPKQSFVELQNNLYQRMPNGYLCANLDEWCQFWDMPATKSVQATAEFVGGKVMDKPTADVHKVSPADFRLVKDSPGQGVLPGGKDLGADVDRVGPGKPYEEWKKTDEYKQWQKKTEELMKAR